MSSHSAKRAGRPLSELLRVPAGPVRLADFDPSATPGYPGHGKSDSQEETDALGVELSDLQEVLYANGRSEPETAPGVLVVLQGMDTSGKGGVIRHAIGLVDPQGVQLAAFKAPTAEERAHDFLWRIRKALPGPGMIGIFDRSHYEDVLVVRVESLVPEAEWRRRYDQINEFEAELVAGGTTVIKCMLNVSFEEQRRRLAERLAEPSKYWKYNPGDVDARLKWPAYQEAYAAALELCNTPDAPWHVIPADRKWYRNWAVAELLREALADLKLDWPPAEFDVATEQARVEAS
ncbi:PPK2 family polyphosphate:nucleotide phosphotransferase [Propionicimonas paludicola]|uniref:PPK2 family polyphosphate:nucleotide phosphotransferase n=1 Tax=Propionicimonas paludicola TaxID=185243 RepID=A0A2A9CR07_9ACTN|nr:polyphosphate kinase 2 family protein [Propionicimonas paludicola]PFG16621.1 PPK2 family polyphosphate:nucleotide phosphotransferase [Propionicimonas paludicola]